ILTVGRIAGLVGDRRLGVLGVQQGPDHFGPLADLCVSGAVAISIDRTFELEQVPEALTYAGQGHSLGKVVVEVDPSP
ncbi:MAG: zinc-binding dehydrogenase, partial [Acidimicrobiales bacterium]